MITIFPTELDRANLEAHSVEPPAEEVVHYDGQIIIKPWGREWQIYRNAQFSIWRLELSPISETSMHAHPSKVTILSVVEGQITFSTLDKRFPLLTGEVVVIEKGVFHKSETVGGAIVMEIESPPNKHDLIRIADKYGREGCGYAAG